MKKNEEHSIASGNNTKDNKKALASKVTVSNGKNKKNKSIKKDKEVTAQKPKIKLSNLSKRTIKKVDSVKKMDLTSTKKTPKNNAIKTSKKENSKSLKIRFLGGVGEIGKNMTVLEFGKDIIIIDAGLTFPNDSMPGVDLVIPDTTYLIQNKSKIRGIIITHGHEDHIGSIPYLLRDINVPVYGTKLTLTLIENKIKEHKINNAILNCVKPASNVKLGVFNIEFINVNHSIAGAVGLAITTPVGVIFHSGDFKIDFTPVNGETIDLARISEIGKKGVLMMMADSTNIEIDGTTMSESVVKDTLDHVFADNIGRRLIIATFASNVHRLQQILDLAVKYKRKVAFSGRSMINIAEASSKIGELSIKDGLIIDIGKIKNFADKDVLIVSTGTQGEPMSALTRMASGEFNSVKITDNDTVVISASVIPGNEKLIYAVINNLYRLGAEVNYSSLEPIHVSGHACRDELKVLHSLVKPKFFIPVHGEYRHLKKHAKLAESLGMRSENILIAEIGDTVELTSSTAKFGERVVAGSKFVDGIGIDGSDSIVIRDRVRMSEDGVIVASLGISQKSGEIKSIEIIGKGLILSETLVLETKANVISTLRQVDLRKIEGQGELANYLKRIIKNQLYKALKKSPMIIPMIVEI